MNAHSNMFCFAGQGAQYVSMGLELAPSWPVITDTYTRADTALGEPLSTIIAQGPQETLTLTANAQPAILALGVAHAHIAQTLNVQPNVLLGHSLGEYAAWVTAGSIPLDDAFRLVRIRGQAMQEAVPVGVGAMTAVISTPSETVAALCKQESRGPNHLVVPSIYNCPGNTVISGHIEAVAAVEHTIASERLGTARRLSVSAPFHCALLAPAAERLRNALQDISIQPNTLPVIPNTTAELLSPGQDPDTIRTLLVDQVTQPVRWEESLRTALHMGVSQAILLGPGSMTRSHLKRIERRFPMVCMDKTSDVEQLSTP